MCVSPPVDLHSHVPRTTGLHPLKGPKLQKRMGKVLLKGVRVRGSRGGGGCGGKPPPPRETLSCYRRRRNFFGRRRCRKFWPNHLRGGGPRGGGGVLDPPPSPPPPGDAELLPKTLQHLRMGRRNDANWGVYTCVKNALSKMQCQSVWGGGGGKRFHEGWSVSCNTTGVQCHVYMRLGRPVC